jgi:hypothetical protein
MMSLILADLVPMAAAMLIGIVTGWWMFRHLRTTSSTPAGPDQA